MKEIYKVYEQNSTVPDFQYLKTNLCEQTEYKVIGGRYYGIIIEAISNFKKYLSTSRYAESKNNNVAEKKNLKKINPPSASKETFPVILKHPVQRDNQIIFPATSLTPELSIAMPENYCDKEIKQVMLTPRHHFYDWELIIQYVLPDIEHSDLDFNHALGIDLGVGNFCTCATNKGDSFILDGRKLKSIVQGFSKYNKKFLKYGNKATKRQASLQWKTANKVRDYLNKSVAYLVDYCVQNHIGTIIIGWGLHFQTFNIGKKNNQIFSFFPYAVFVDALKAKCERHGIICRKTDESFTSKASALDLDPIPAFVTNAEQHFSGHRRYRGIYITKGGIKINSDVNGAINVLRKSNAVTDEQIARLSSRGLAPPQRIFVL